MTTLQDKAATAPGFAGTARGDASGPLHWHVIRAVFDRNFLAYFSNPAGYVFVVLFVLLGAIAAFWRPEFFANNLAGLATLNDLMPLLLVVFIPAITMSAWAEERRQGTDELLLTLPARDVEVVLGKYLAALGIYTTALVFSLTHVVVLRYVGDPDFGVLASTYLGYWLMGVLMVAIGLVASLLSSNVTVAFILGAVFCAVPVFIGLVGSLFAGPTRRAFEDLSVPSQFRDFGAGVVTFSGVLYFVTLAGAMLYLNMILLGRRQWAGGERSRGLAAHSLARVVAVVVALVAVDSLASSKLGRARADWSSEHLSTLTAESRSIIKAIPDDRPVFIQAYYSPEVPREMVEAKNSLLALLREYEALGDGKIRLNLVETELYSPAASEAQKRFGIEPKQVVTQDEARQSASEVFLGVAFTSGLEEVVVPFFDPGLPTEYELTRSIRVVSKSGRKKVGILGTDAKMLGGFDFRSMGQETEWAFVTELKKQYEVSSVAPDGPIPANLDVLLVAQPSSMTQRQIDTLTDYVRQGHPTLLFHDPFPRFNPSLSPEVPKMPPGGPMAGGQQPEPKGRIDALLDLLGVDAPGDEIVWNRYNPLPNMPDLPYEFVFVGKGSGGDSAFNPSEPESSGLQNLVMMYPGLVRPKSSKPEFKPLLRVGGVGGTVRFDDLVEQSFMGIRGINPNRRYIPSNQEYTLAARIEGVPADAPKPRDDDPTKKDPPKKDDEKKAVKAILIGDLDLIGEQFFEIRRQKIKNLDFDNVTFVLNCVDILAGDDAYIALRKHRPRYRTLTELEKQIRIYDEKSQKETRQAEDDAEAALKAAQKSLDDKVAKLKDDREIPERDREVKLQILEKVENRRLAVEKAAIQDEKRRKVQTIKGEREQSIRTIENRVRLGALVASPLPALILAGFVFGARAGRENRGANPNRLAD